MQLSNTTKKTTYAVCLLALAAVMASPFFFASRAPMPQQLDPTTLRLNRGGDARPFRSPEQDAAALDTERRLNADAVDGNLLLWGPYRFDPTRGMPDFAPLYGGINTAPTGVATGPAYVIVQAPERITEGWRNSLRGLGAEIMGYANNNAYLVRVDATKVNAVRGIARAVVPFAPAMKMVESVRDMATVSNPYMSNYAHAIDENGFVTLDVWGHRGFTADAIAPAVLSAHPGVVSLVGTEPIEDTKGAVKVKVDALQFASVVGALINMSEVSDVILVEPVKAYNYTRGAILQTGTAGNFNIWNKGVTGYGQTTSQQDSGLQYIPCWFRYGSTVPTCYSDGTLCTTNSTPQPRCPTEKIIALLVAETSNCLDPDFGDPGGHGTAVMGCMAGDRYDTNGLASETGVTTTDTSETGLGMAPGAQVTSTAGSGSCGGCGFNEPWSLFHYDAANELTKAGQNEWLAFIGARVNNNSWGAGFNPNGSYDGTSATVDQVTWWMRDWSVFWAAGNDGPNASTLGNTGSTAKNSVTVGGAEAGNPQNLVSSSSRGPTVDGRQKPDVCGFWGTQSACRGACCTATFGGTSNASPTIAGMGILATEYFTDGYYPEGVDSRGGAVPTNTRDQSFPIGSGGTSDGGFSPSNALIKAILINSAVNMTGTNAGTRPNNSQGWGRVRLDDALFFSAGGAELRAVLVLNDVLNGATSVVDGGGRALARGEQPTPAIVTGQTHTFDFNVGLSGTMGGEGGLKITLVWSDPYKSPAQVSSTSPALVNNLNLRVTSPGGTIYRGNIFGGTNTVLGAGPWSTAGAGDGTTDVRNPVECVLIDAINGNTGKEAGLWRARVIGANVPGNGQNRSQARPGGHSIQDVYQGYALVAVGNVTAGTTAKLAWNRSVYNCGEKATKTAGDPSPTGWSNPVANAYVTLKDANATAPQQHPNGPAGTHIRARSSADNFASIRDTEYFAASIGAAPIWQTPNFRVESGTQANGDGVLQVLHNDRVDAHYVDDLPAGYQARTVSTVNCGFTMVMVVDEHSAGCDGYGTMFKEFLDAGEVLTFTHEAKLLTQDPLRDLWITVTSTNAKITVYNPIQQVGLLLPGESFLFAFTVGAELTVTAGETVTFQVRGTSYPDGLTLPSGYDRLYEMERDWSVQYFHTDYPTGHAGNGANSFAPNPWRSSGAYNSPQQGGRNAVLGGGNAPWTFSGSLQGWDVVGAYCGFFANYYCNVHKDYVWSGATTTCGHQNVSGTGAATGAGAVVQYVRNAPSCTSEAAPGTNSALCRVENPYGWFCYADCSDPNSPACYNFVASIARSPILEKVFPFGTVPHNHTTWSSGDWHTEFMRTGHHANYNYRYWTNADQTQSAGAFWLLTFDGDTAQAGTAATGGCYVGETTYSGGVTNNPFRCGQSTCSRGTPTLWISQWSSDMQWNEPADGNRVNIQIHSRSQGRKDPGDNPNCVFDGSGPETDQVLTPFGQIGNGFRFGWWEYYWDDMNSGLSLGTYGLDNPYVEWREFQAVNDANNNTTCNSNNPPMIWFQAMTYTICDREDGGKVEMMVQHLSTKKGAGSVTVQVASANTGDIEDVVLLETSQQGFFKGNVPLSTESLNQVDGIVYVTTRDALLASYITGEAQYGTISTVALTACENVPVYYLKHEVLDGTSPVFNCADADFDGFLDGNERSDVAVYLNNIHKGLTLINAEVTVRSNDPAIRVCTSTVAFGDIPPKTVVSSHDVGVYFNMAADNALITWPTSTQPYVAEVDVHIKGENSDGSPARNLMRMSLDVNVTTAGVPLNGDSTWYMDFNSCTANANSCGSSSGKTALGHVAFFSDVVPASHPSLKFCPTSRDFCGTDDMIYSATNQWHMTTNAINRVRGDVLPTISANSDNGRSFHSGKGYNANDTFGGIQALKVDYAYTSLLAFSEDQGSWPAEMQFYHLAHVRGNADGGDEFGVDIVGDGVVVQVLRHQDAGTTYGTSPFDPLSPKWQTVYAVDNPYESFLIGFDEEAARRRFVYCRFTPTCGKRLPVYGRQGTPPTTFWGDTVQPYEFKVSTFDLGDFRAQRVWLRWVFSSMYFQFDEPLDGYFLDNVFIFGVMSTAPGLAQDTKTFGACTLCAPPIARFKYSQCSSTPNTGSSDQTNCPTGGANMAVYGAPSLPDAAYAITFDATCSFAPCGTPEYWFDFDNNGSWDIVGFDPIVSWTYLFTELPATVRLRVTCGAEWSEAVIALGKQPSGSCTGDCTFDPALAVAPTVNGVPYTGSPLALTLCQGQSAAFVANPSGGTAPHHCAWNFDGGPNVTDCTVNYAYFSTGSYNVTLKVNDSCSLGTRYWPGPTGTETALIAQVTVSPLPTAAPTDSPDPSVVGQAVTFTANASCPNGCKSFFWQFGDGGTSSQENPTYTYTQCPSLTNAYAVSLTVTDNSGCQVTASIPHDVVCPSVVYNSAVGLTYTQFCGNSDAFNTVEPGEIYDVSVPLINAGVADATNVSASLAITNTNGVISVLTNPQSYGNMAVGQTVSRTFRFSVAENYPCYNTENISVVAIVSSERLYPDNNNIAVLPVGVNNVVSETASQESAITGWATTNSSLTRNFIPNLTTTSPVSLAQFNWPAVSACYLTCACNFCDTDLWVYDSLKLSIRRGTAAYLLLKNCATDPQAIYDVTAHYNSAAGGPGQWNMCVVRGTSTACTTASCGGETTYQCTIGGPGCPAVANVSIDGAYISTEKNQLQCSGSTACICGNGTLTTNPSASPNPVCFNTATSFTANVSGGSSPYTYEWDFTNDSIFDSTAASPSFTYASAGTYVARLRLTDNASCVVDKTFSVVVRALPTASPSSNPNPSTPGQQVQFSANASGQAPLLFAWDFSYDGVTFNSEGLVQDPTWTYSSGGTYTVALRITDANGCQSSTITFTHNVGTCVQPTVTISGATSRCASDPCTTLTANPSGGSGSGYTYLWSPGGQTTQSICVSPASTTTYTVTVTDGAGCTSNPSAGHTLTVNANPTPVISGPTSRCAGAPCTTLDAGAGYASYLWSTGQTTQTICVTGTATRTVTVTTAAGCSGTSPSHTLTENSNPTVSISGNSSRCAADACTTLTANPSGGSGSGYTYLWSPGGATTASICVSPASTTDYTVVVTDSNGCSGTSAIHTLTVNANPTPVISGATSRCSADACTTLDAGAGYSSYLWSPGGATTQTICVSPASTTGYTVTVTAANGCMGTSPSHTLTVNASPSATFTHNAASPDHCVTDAINFTGPSGGGGTQNIFSDPADSLAGWTQTGTNAVQNTAASGCFTGGNNFALSTNNQSASITRTVSTVGYTSIVVRTDWRKQNLDGGECVTFEYSTNGGGAWTTWFQSCTTDAPNGAWACGQSSAVLPVAAENNANFMIRFSVNCNANNEQLWLDNIVVQGNSGSSLTYAWDFEYPSGTDSTAQNPTHTYGTTGLKTVRLTTSDGTCTNYTEQTINVITCACTKPTVTISGATTRCAADACTTLTANPSGGSGSGYTYLWSNAATTQTICVTGTGTYTVTVTDGAGCTSDPSASHTLTENANPTPVITGATTRCAADPCTTLDAGAGYASYLWSTGQTTQTICVTGTATRTVTVTDGNGCSGTSASHTLTENANPTPVITGATTRCAADPCTTLDAGAGYASYLWSTGQTTQTICVTGTATRTVTVTNAAGCSGTSPSHTLTENANPTPSITASCNGTSRNLDAGAGYTSYLWSPGGATTQVIDVADDGSNYTVTVTNAAGCTGQASHSAVLGCDVSLPGEVTPTDWSDTDTLNWAVTAGAEWYNVYRDDVTGLATGAGNCLSQNIVGTSWTEVQSPAAGATWFYLISAESSAGEGPLGTDSDGQVRVAATPCP